MMFQLGKLTTDSSRPRLAFLALVISIAILNLLKISATIPIKALLAVSVGSSFGKPGKRF
jgi:hypothetical protein